MSLLAELGKTVGEVGKRVFCLIMTKGCESSMGREFTGRARCSGTCGNWQCIHGMKARAGDIKSAERG